MADHMFPIELDAVVLECGDIESLAGFYTRLLGWKRNYEEPGEWIDLVSPSGGAKIAFQQNDGYQPPVWPDESGRQQQMAHLDFAVKNAAQMEEAVRHALDCGATRAGTQFGGDEWTTLLDPAGHPFCFVIW